MQVLILSLRNITQNSIKNNIFFPKEGLLLGSVSSYIRTKEIKLKKEIDTKAFRLLQHDGIRPLCVSLDTALGTFRVHVVRHGGIWAPVPSVSKDTEARRTPRVERHIGVGSPRLLLPPAAFSSPWLPTSAFCRLVG
jgi:hypothetical protein